MKKLSALCLAGYLLTASSFAMAWESGDHSTSASVASSSDYVWRGVTQTLEDPAISGSVDYAHASGFYAGFGFDVRYFGANSVLEDYWAAGDDASDSVVFTISKSMYV